MATTTLYVVSHQSYLYGDEYDDIERVLEGFDVRGVFSTKQKAQDFISEYMRQTAAGLFGENVKKGDDNYKYNKKFFEEEPYHWSITELELDKQIFDD